MAKQPKLKTKIVEPSVIEPGKPHVMERMFEAGRMPTLKSVGFAQLPDSNTWVAYVLTTKGKDVLKIEVEEPNLKQIAEESAKASFVTQLIDAGAT